ncbi:MAG: hypothetical protein RR363_03590 [Rikenellaceae bacterium]
MSANIVRKIQKRYKILGLSGTVILIITKTLQLIGVNLRFYYFFVKKDRQKISDDRYTLTTPSLDDFESKEKNPNRLLSVRYKFSMDSEIPFSVFIDGDMAYSCWVSTSMLRFPKSFLKVIPLSENEVFLSDCFCYEKYRKQGIHSYVTKTLTPALFGDKKDKICTIVEKFNLSSIKGFEKGGFKKEFQFHILTFGNMSYTNISKKRSKHY